MVGLRTVFVSHASDGVVHSAGGLSIRACSEAMLLHPYFVARRLLGTYCRLAQLVQLSSREPCSATTPCGTRDSTFTITLSPKGALKVPAPYPGCNSSRLACCMLNEAPAAVTTRAQLRTMPPTTAATSPRSKTGPFNHPIGDKNGEWSSTI